MKFILPLALISFASAAFAVGPTKVILKNPSGREVGVATLTSLAKGVRISLEVQGLTPGEHAFHIHEKGACTGPKFDSAGGHLAVATKTHGFDMAEGPHEGDMPNLIVVADGKAKIEYVNTTVALSPESLLRPGGTALVIHEKADDYKSQPAGNAGARIACGAIN